ncbi:MAG: B-box zinc finger protein [Candidatus Hydrogenedentota bacterium]
MVDATRSACINHPGVEATHRCKQCGRPVCDTCTIMGPTGRFCSENCRTTHEAFVQRARQLETKTRVGFGVRLRNFLGSLIVVVIVAAVVLGIGHFFEVPVLRDIAARLLEFAGQAQY